MTQLPKWIVLSGLFSVLTAVVLPQATAQEWSGDTAFDSEGVSIRYVEQGQGEPVILIHGYTSSVEANWGVIGAVAALAEDFRVVAMDVRGHGKSDKPHDPAAYGLEVVHDIRRLMDHLGFDTASLVGYSMGGELALTFATMFPDRVDRVVMGGAGMMIEGDVGHAFYAYLADALGSLQPGQSVSDAMGPGLALSDDARRMFDSNDPAALAATATAMLDLTVDPSDLASNDVPVLLLIGEDDEFKAQADAALAVGAKIEMHVLPGRHHMNAPQDPDFLPTIRSFLQR